MMITHGQILIVMIILSMNWCLWWSTMAKYWSIWWMYRYSYVCDDQTLSNIGYDHQNVEQSCKFIHVSAFWSNMFIMITHDQMLIVMTILSIQLCLWRSKMVKYWLLSSFCGCIYHSHVGYEWKCVSKTC